MKLHFRAALAALVLLTYMCPFAAAQTAAASDAENGTTGASADAGAGPSAGQIAGVAIPSALVLYGVISLTSGDLRSLDYQTRAEILEHNRMWHTQADDYLQFAPAAAAFVMKLTGVESKNSFLDMGLMYGLSNAVQGTLVTSVKYLANRERPDGSNHFSFPSGHTATAFVAAEFLHQEYGHKSIFIDIAGYGVATFVGVARVYKNRHWVSDVVAGAGVGILSTKGIYWAYPKLKEKWFGKHEHGKEKMQVTPVLEYNGGGASLAIVCRF